MYQSICLPNLCVIISYTTSDILIRVQSKVKELGRGDLVQILSGSLLSNDGLTSATVVAMSHDMNSFETVNIEENSSLCLRVWDLFHLKCSAQNTKQTLVMVSRLC